MVSASFGTSRCGMEVLRRVRDFGQSEKCADQNKFKAAKETIVAHQKTFPA